MSRNKTHWYSAASASYADLLRLLQRPVNAGSRKDMNYGLPEPAVDQDVQNTAA